MRTVLGQAVCQDLHCEAAHGCPCQHCAHHLQAEQSQLCVCGEQLLNGQDEVESVARALSTVCVLRMVFAQVVCQDLHCEAASTVLTACRPERSTGCL